MRLFAIVGLLGCTGERTPEIEPPADLEVVDGMVKVPAATITLGPRHIAPVDGFEAPSGPGGMTPNMGEGSNNRDPGAPPPVGQPPGGQQGGQQGNQGGGQGGQHGQKHQAPGHPPGQKPPPGKQSSGAQGPTGPDAPAGPTGQNPPDSRGAHHGSPTQDGVAPGNVGHVRSGSAPSAPPGMPGNNLNGTVAKVAWETGMGGQRLQSREVAVSTFWIDLTEVTRTQYQAFLVDSGYRPPFVAEDWANDDGWNWSGTDYPPGTADHPVVMASWYDASEFCAWAGKRLPTESEWQLAALGTDGRVFPWGSDYSGDRLNHGKMDAPNFVDSDGDEFTSPVDAFPSGRSPYGLYDAFGNAWEFTADYRRDDWSLYEDGTGTALSGPVGQLSNDITSPGPGLYVAVRGGAYFFDLRPNPGGERNEFLPEVRRKTSGFRCAKDAAE